MREVLKKICNWMTKEKLFNIISIIFLLSCCGFFGYRALYYKKYFNSLNIKVDPDKLLINQISKETIKKGNGLYEENGALVYKGKIDNNYIKYSGYIWRIIKINSDSSIEIVMDKPLNYMMYDQEMKDYLHSNINEYLNNYFIKTLNTNYILKSVLCLDNVEKINEIKCENKNYDYQVKLLSIIDYLNSRIDNESYLDDEDVLLMNNNSQKVWKINNKNLSLNNTDNMYKIKPVVLLSNQIKYINGNGTKDNPYNIDENWEYGSYVKLGTDLYRIYDNNENILKLVSDTVFMNGEKKSQYNFSSETELNNISISKFLNNNILESLKYKEKLTECSWNYGKYNGDYKSILKNTYTSKISMLNVIDPIYNYEINDYYFINTINDHAYIYDNMVLDIPQYINKNIRWTICLDKTKIISGNGEINTPYIINEV